MKYVRKLKKDGFFTYFVNTNFWDPNSDYMKEVRKTAKRLDTISRVFVINNKKDLESKSLKEQIKLDLKANMKLYYIELADMFSITQTLDFGI